MTVTPRGQHATWANGNHQLAPEVGWILFAMAILLPVLHTVHKPPTYISKSKQSLYKRLMGQWGQVLKFWIKKASKGYMAMKTSAPTQPSHSPNILHIALTCNHKPSSCCKS